ncbi:MAG: hypothetical protein V4708_11475 [Bacteroidota bacterium]
MENFDPDYFDPHYEERTYAVRGKIIAHFAMFEKNIEALLAAEFSTDSAYRQKMQNIVFDRMTFDSKRTSVKTILVNRAIEDGFEPSKKKSHPHKKLLEELAYLNSIRNQFAHYPTIQATNKSEYSYAIGLMEYRDSPNCKWFTPKEIDIIINRIQAAKVEILAFIKKKPSHI